MKIFKFTFISLVSLLLTSCAIPSLVTKNVSYVSPIFSKTELEKGGLALLPIVAGSGVEGYRRPFGEAMNSIADSVLSNFMPWQVTLDRINETGLVKEYSNAIKSYQETGIINRSVLKEMSNATGMNYFFFVRLSPPTENTDVSYSVLTGTSSSKTQSIIALGLVWSALDGDVAWEGSAKAKVTTSGYNYAMDTDMQRAIKVAKVLMTSLVE